MSTIRKLAVVFTLIVCSNIAYAQKWANCRGRDIPGENIYKHYTGTFGDRKIALDLRFGFCGGSNYGGSRYYYPGKIGATLFIIGEPDSFDLNITLYGEEQPEEQVLWVDNNHWPDRSKLPRWTFRIKDNKLTGTWISADKKEQRNISLTEDYSSSVPMELASYSEKTPETRLIYTRPSAAAKPDEAAFITDEELLFLGGANKSAHDWVSYFKLAKVNTPWMTMLMPEYNDNGFLVFEKKTVSKTGNDYNSRYSYLCLDVRNKKKVELNDILNVDNKQLPNLLEAALRTKYNMGKDEKLSASFLFEKMPVSPNILLTEQGIIFCYNFDEVVVKQENLSQAEDQIKVFLSYAQLKDVLRDDFKKRIGK